jgi:phosphomannomutase
VNGDGVMLVAARDMHAKGELTGNLVVATTMSNMGLEAALRRGGITMLRAPVGDKYVLEMMQKHNASLGGEQSGHILFPGRSTTGDGLLTALVLLDLLARSGEPLHDLLSDCQRASAGEAAARSDSERGGNHSPGRERFERKWPCGGALLWYRGPGKSDD